MKKCRFLVAGMAFLIFCMLGNGCVPPPPHQSPAKPPAPPGGPAAVVIHPPTATLTD